VPTYAFVLNDVDLHPTDKLNSAEGLDKNSILEMRMKNDSDVRVRHCKKVLSKVRNIFIFILSVLVCD
jgi:hypothetical protein